MGWKKTVIISLAIASVAFYIGRCSQEIEAKKQATQIKSEKSIEYNIQDIEKEKGAEKSELETINAQYLDLDENYKVNLAAYQAVAKIQYEK